MREELEKVRGGEVGKCEGILGILGRGIRGGGVLELMVNEEKGRDGKLGEIRGREENKGVEEG